MSSRLHVFIYLRLHALMNYLFPHHLCFALLCPHILMLLCCHDLRCYPHALMSLCFYALTLLFSHSFTSSSHLHTLISLLTPPRLHAFMFSYPHELTISRSHGLTYIHLHFSTFFLHVLKSILIPSYPNLDPYNNSCTSLFSLFYLYSFTLHRCLHRPCHLGILWLT